MDINHFKSNYSVILAVALYNVEINFKGNL